MDIGSRRRRATASVYFVLLLTALAVVGFVSSEVRGPRDAERAARFGADASCGEAALDTSGSRALADSSAQSTGACRVVSVHVVDRRILNVRVGASYGLELLDDHGARELAWLTGARDRTLYEAAPPGTVLLALRYTDSMVRGSAVTAALRLDSIVVRTEANPLWRDDESHSDRWGFAILAAVDVVLLALALWRRSRISSAFE